MFYTLLRSYDYVITLDFDKYDNITSWHLKFGHMTKNSMRILSSNDVFSGMKNLIFKFYKEYVYAKLKKSISQAHRKDIITER